MSINIGKNKDDPFYRYKRNIIDITYNNKKGGTTTINNMNIIAKQLKVPEEFVKKFYKIIKKSGRPMLSNGVFKGKLEINDLEELLEQMIEKYLLCSKCELPELVGKTCNACGNVNKF